MLQRCYLVSVYAAYALLAALVVSMAWTMGLLAGALTLGAGLLALWSYVRWFPRISPLLGYGRVDDAPSTSEDPIHARATLYTALGCPFCPIVAERLDKIAARHAVDVQRVDVTLRPGILLVKGIRATPVLEADGRILVGNLTTPEIEEFLRQATARRLREVAIAA